VIKRIAGALLFLWFASTTVVAAIWLVRPHAQVDTAPYIGALLLSIALAAISIEMMFNKKKPPESQQP
jgi:hypothetical protein